MTTLVLVRHGATAWNDNRYCQGRKDVALSARGRAQAKLLGAALRAFEFDRILCSPLSRAIETLRIAGYEGETVPDLVEIDRGHWEGHAMEEVRRRWGRLCRRWYEDPRGLTLPGGEAFDAFWERAGGVWDRLRTDPAGPRLVAGHKATNRALLARALGRLPPEVWGISQPQAGLSVLVRAGEGWRADRLGDVSHLPPEYRADS
ncbi:MAG: histidine phosphatase family protein [Planctomycetota bacterium]